MTRVSLERLRFSGFHKSYVGAIRSCLAYWDIPVSAAWTYGITGNAFLSVIDEGMRAPNTGEPETESYEAARLLGLKINGLHTFSDQESLPRLQVDAWQAARAALDRGLPVFAKDLDIGNETSVVYGYDETGYYTHSWHSGSGHEGAEQAIPWNMLGKSFCPCFSCARQRSAIDSPSQAEERDDGLLVSLHWAEKTEPADDKTALRAAIDIALRHSARASYEWGGRRFYSGTAAIRKWKEHVQSEMIECFYMGYYLDLFHESRHYAFLFWKEAGERIGGALTELFREAADHYGRIKDEYRALSGMFPWMQPRELLTDPDRRREALERLHRLESLEADGYELLKQIRDKL